MANDPRFEVYPRRHAADAVAADAIIGEPTGDFGWRFRAANGQITAVGGEGFTREQDAERAVRDFAEAFINMSLRGGIMASAPHLPLMHEVLDNLTIVRVED